MEEIELIALTNNGEGFKVTDSIEEGLIASAE